MIDILIEKGNRILTALEDGKTLFTCRVGLGPRPGEAKKQEGDGRTPEGEYRVCLMKNPGKYGRSLGLSYPSARDAESAFHEGRINAATRGAILLAHREGRRPPWGSPLGGEIYIHEGGSGRDWTQGCIALDSSDMDRLWPLRDEIGRVIIRP